MAEPAVSGAAAAEQADERLYLASQWRLMWRRLGRHRVALAGGVVLLLFYFTMCLGAEFFAPNTAQTRFKQFSFAPPSRIRVVDAEGFVEFMAGHAPEVLCANARVGGRPVAGRCSGRGIR